MKAVASRDNPTFKQLRLLADDGREIRRRQQTLLDGPHLLRACLDAGKIPAMILLAESAQDNREAAELIARCAQVERVTFRDSLFAELSGVASPVGIAALIDLPPEPDAAVTGDCVLLDGIQDAGNVGTILRTAAAAGVTDVVLGAGCAGAWTPRVLRAAQGAHFQLRLHEQRELSAWLDAYSGQIAATVTRDGTSVFAAELAGPTAWLFGSEGRGVEPRLIERAGLRLTIPLAAGAESLNVAAAAAVCLFEAVRQRGLRA